jgi:hypothetical protein
MAKRQSFADKASKKKHVVNCQVCGSPITPTAFILPLNTDTGSVKYKRSIVGICKCNHKKYYG